MSSRHYPARFARAEKIAKHFAVPASVQVTRLCKRSSAMAHLDSRTLTVLAALGFCLIAVPAGAATETVLYSFQGAPNGGSPSGALSADASGNLYGATSVGGTGSCLAGAENEGCGTIYQLSPPPTGQTGWTEKVLYSFKAGTDGADPQAGLATGTGGVLYGTTTGGGDSDNQGVVFQLTPPAAGKTAGEWCGEAGRRSIFRPCATTGPVAYPIAEYGVACRRLSNSITPG